MIKLLFDFILKHVKNLNIIWILIICFVGVWALESILNFVIFGLYVGCVIMLQIILVKMALSIKGNSLNRLASSNIKKWFMELNNFNKMLQIILTIIIPISVVYVGNIIDSIENYWVNALSLRVDNIGTIQLILTGFISSNIYIIYIYGNNL